MGPEETDMFITLKPRERWTVMTAKGERITTQAELVQLIREEIEDLPGQRHHHHPAHSSSVWRR